MYKKQCVVRTESNGGIERQSLLSQKLEEGWEVIFVTKIKDGLLEYILEKTFEK